jgi:hypothetical protein
MNYSDAEFQEFLAALGGMVVAWNRVEQSAQIMAVGLMGGGDKPDAVISNLGNVALREAIETLANEFAPADTAAHILHFTKCFDALREHRNWLVHSVLLLGTNDAGVVGVQQALSARQRIVLHQGTVTREEITKRTKQIEELDRYGGHIIAHLWGLPQEVLPQGLPLSLREKPPLPDRLQKPRQFRPDAKRPPGST